MLDAREKRRRRRRRKKKKKRSTERVRERGGGKDDHGDRRDRLINFWNELQRNIYYNTSIIRVWSIIVMSYTSSHDPLSIPRSYCNHYACRVPAYFSVFERKRNLWKTRAFWRRPPTTIRAIITRLRRRRREFVGVVVVVNGGGSVAAVRRWPAPMVGGRESRNYWPQTSHTHTSRFHQRTATARHRSSPSVRRARFLQSLWYVGLYYYIIGILAAVV